MENKKKCYVLIMSESFPKNHIRSGDATDFIEKIKINVKKHTVRGNYQLWKKRVKKINEGNAYLSIRIWSGVPHRSKQNEIMTIEKIGIQKVIFVSFLHNIYSHLIVWNNFLKSPFLIPANDGLSAVDFYAWFFPNPKKGLNVFDGCILHFTDFRY